MKTILLATVLVLVALPSYGMLKEHTATITKFYGKVRLFINPSKTKQGPGPFVKTGDIYYTVQKAKVGMRLKPSDRIQTGKKAKAKVVYDNGDQITMSGGTSYEVTLDSSSGVKKPILDIFFGKIRGLIQKGGTRSGMKVRSTSMVMGVRGTDFFVAARDEKGQSEVSVFRGEVEIKQKQSKAPPVKVPAGFSVKVPEKSAKTVKTAPKLRVKPTSKSKIVKIYKESVISKKELKAAGAETVNPEVQKAVNKLERKAIKAVKNDIKTHDPELYKRIASIPEEKIASPEALVSFTTKKAFEAAPKEKKSNSKATFKDLDHSDVYDQYLKD